MHQKVEKSSPAASAGGVGKGEQGDSHTPDLQ